MRLLAQTLCLLLALTLSCAAPTHHDIMMADHDGTDHHHHEDQHDHKDPDRCDGIEFDAIAPDEKGITYFFKGDHLWRGFRGPAELSNGTFKELDDHHHIGHVDAAFRMHNEDDHSDHDHIFFFLDDKVFSYYNHSLEPGYPKEIEEVFPGIPKHLDAAVECPKGECTLDSVIFFKGDEVYNYDIATKTVKQKKWPHLPHCTSAYRWLERYYCFHGHNFTRFHPLTGEVELGYPKDARNYFMKCENFGHGTGSVNCTDAAHLDAVTSDVKGKSYAFRGEMYLRLDSHRDGWHAFSISSAWKEVHGDVNAVFFYDGKLYIIKGDEIYIYKTEAHYTLVEGYPKPLKEELGIEGPVDAAFVCADEQHTVHVIQGRNIKYIDLSATPRSVVKDIPISFKIDAASCGPDGVKVYVGKEFFQYASPMIMAMGKIKAVPHQIPQEMLGCSN
ncbi:hypothetical protein SKAU_G00239710 [Synaphobranchus kaupii]|uniref:Hemopexin n=1 Tax=Synaphobranchus kaupii TaxID=118154 RepID=A0A9Q1IT77_SYNKA|nr:hypothetical protein SKAU_G00239710 [Synaphobranchus kaupii]